jgi:uncharacterized protein YaiI (UPF0178 family)
VKDEVYKVAFRREVPVRVVSNARIRVPSHPLIERVLVSGKFDAADDWIAVEADAKTVVITGDILLADRCLKSGATVIGHNGKPFTSARLAGPSRPARSWPTCGREAMRSADRRRLPRRTVRGSCRRWTKRW